MAAPLSPPVLDPDARAVLLRAKLAQLMAARASRGAAPPAALSLASPVRTCTTAAMPADAAPAARSQRTNDGSGAAGCREPPVAHSSSTSSFARRRSVRRRRWATQRASALRARQMAATDQSLMSAPTSRARWHRWRIGWIEQF
jgi:hypothetical protein